MKAEFRILAVALAITLIHDVSAQICTERYKDARFPIVKHTDIVYGNAPELTAIYLGENFTNNVDLKMDIFEPFPDTAALRPALVFAYGGAYIFGSKEDEDIQGVCDTFAKKGYVTAAINYRMNLNILSGNSAERAVYRSLQDYSAAVRFLKEFHQLYKIDTNKIFIGGVSAGAFAALHLAYTEDADRPASTYSGGIFTPWPDLGCIDCSGNNYNHSSNVHAVVNCWGAIGDLNWIDASDQVPIVSFHGDQDLIVPYNSGVPFTALVTLPTVYGSNQIHQRANNIGLLNNFYSFPGEGHSVWGTVVANQFAGGPTSYWQPILNSITDFLFNFVKTEDACFQCGQQICNEPSAIFSTGTSCAAVTLHWDTSNCAVGYNIRGRRLGSTNWVTLPIPGRSTDHFSVTGLPCSTGFEWQIQSSCLSGTVHSDWSSTDTFYTNGCVVPTLTGATFTGNQTTLTWSPVTCAIGYQIFGNKTGINNPVSLYVSGGNSSSYAISGLSCSSAYYWSIRSICSCSGQTTSGLAPVDTFSTPSCKNVLSVHATSRTQSDLAYLYPNPAKDHVRISLPLEALHENVVIRVFDLNGKLRLYRQVSNQTEVALSRSEMDMTAGSYICEITVQKHRQFIRLVFLD